MTTQTKPVYMGEAQLVRWADSGNAGRTVTLRIDEHPDLHPFKGLKCGDTGQRFEIVCVAKDDNEQPIDPENARASTRHKARPETSESPKRERKRSEIAALKLQDESFQIWLAETYRNIWDKHYYGELAYVADATSGAANSTLKEVLGIQSKKELDVIGSSEAEHWDRLLASYDYKDRT